MTEQRTLDYRIGGPLDPSNKNYRVGAANPELMQRSRYWVPGPVLDQGREGACVGFGVVAEALASPVRVKAFRTRDPLYLTTNPDLAARDVYRTAQAIDPWPETHEGGAEGTSVLAGMKVGQERGWWSGYRWALNMAELRAALEEGPVVIGVEWRSGMYRALGGILSVSGGVVGGHCILITGYTPRHRTAKGSAYRLRNSWSEDWGVNGSAYISADDLDGILFQAGGEASVPVGRAA